MFNEEGPCIQCIECEAVIRSDEEHHTQHCMCSATKGTNISISGGRKRVSIACAPGGMYIYVDELGNPVSPAWPLKGPEDE